MSTRKLRTGAFTALVPFGHLRNVIVSWLRVIHFITSTIPTLTMAARKQFQLAAMIIHRVDDVVEFVRLL